MDALNEAKNESENSSHLNDGATVPAAPAGNMAMRAIAEREILRAALRCAQGRLRDIQRACGGGNEETLEVITLALSEGHTS